ncbi:MAG: HD domain-containing protein [Thermodesulfobacteriota bacterium]|nr:HD domain-containing protein [Thermodesulfobacteriota bacterium]
MRKNTPLDQELLRVKDILNTRERNNLSPLASFSRDGIRRNLEDIEGHRQTYALDGDRILHSHAYTRYIDKTQVFSLVDNDHITHRVLHVQLVSKIARTVGRFLGLNEDLLEAIAIGHDIGHPPFGHDGERMLSELCVEQGLASFQHNIQSVRFLDLIEKQGKGCNLTIQTLDGILCHDGEDQNVLLKPERGKTFSDLDHDIARKSKAPEIELLPMTLEGCVVRLADSVSYVGRDIEDAIELRLISRNDIPDQCRKILGSTNGTIVYTLVEDLIANGIEDDRVGFSSDIGHSLKLLKEFNFKRIYLNPAIKKGFDRIRACFRALFESYLDHIDKGRRDSAIFKRFLDHMDKGYFSSHQPEEIVRDFIAGMTDNYFVDQARFIGCETPEKIELK